MAQTHSLDLEASSSQYAGVADTAALDITGNLTLMAWYTPESFATSAEHNIITKWRTTDNNRSYRLIVESAQLRLDTSSAGTAETQSTAAFTFVPGRTYHVAVSCSSTTATLYVDGRNIGTATCESSKFNSAAPFRVGANGNGTPSGFADGLIKDVRVFGSALTQAQIIAAAYSENYTGVTPAGEWNFNNAYTDSSGNGNTLTASGSPVFSTTIPWTKPSQGSGAQFIGNAVSWWTMDEASGSRADSVGSNTLTDNNTVLAATGVWSNAADFERTNSEYLSITDASQSGLDFSADFSVALWVNLETALSSGDMGVLDKYGSAGNRSYRIDLSHSGGTDRIEGFVSDDGTSVSNMTANFPSNLSTSTDYFIVASYDASAGTMNWYLNDSLFATVTGGKTSIFNSSANVFVGSVGGTAAFADGWYDEMSVYSTALDYGNVLDLYASGSGIPYSEAADTANAIFFGANF